MNYRRIAAAVLILLLFCHGGWAEDYVDLNERFSGVTTFERDGATYYLKERLTTVLAACVGVDAQGAPRLELTVLLTADDNAKTVTLWQLDGGMRAEWPEGAESLNAVLASGATPGEGLARVAAAVDGLFPAPVIDGYIALDVQGLPLLDGVENDGVNTSGDALVNRLRAIRDGASGASVNALSGMLTSLGDHVMTDMKSGALMKIADKADRYEVGHRIPLPVVGAEDAPELDADAFAALMLETFFNDQSMW